MAPKAYNEHIEHQAKSVLTGLFFGIVLLAMMLLPELAFAQATGGSGTNDFNPTGQKVCSFFGNINNILNMTSIAVVTAAVVFSGYQIAFAHKRIGDVAPVLIGGVLIGCAGQVAKMVIGDTGQTCQAGVDTALRYMMSRYA